MKNCIRCGAEIPEGSNVCPHCGVETAKTAPGPSEGEKLSGQAPVQQPPAAPVQTAPAQIPAPESAAKKKPINAFGLVGMIVGIVSCCFGGVVGIVLGVIAVVFSGVGLYKKSTTRLYGFAVAGLATGLVAIVYCIIYMAVLF